MSDVPVCMSTTYSSAGASQASPSGNMIPAKKKGCHSINHRFPNGAFLGLLTESPVNVLDEHTAKVIRDRRETATANHQALALRRVMREAAVCREY